MYSINIDLKNNKKPSQILLFLLLNLLFFKLGHICVTFIKLSGYLNQEIETRKLKILQ